MVSQGRERAFCVAALSGPRGIEPDRRSEGDGTGVASIYTSVAEQSQVQRKANRKGWIEDGRGWGDEETRPNAPNPPPHTHLCLYIEFPELISDPGPFNATQFGVCACIHRHMHVTIQ